MLTEQEQQFLDAAHAGNNEEVSKFLAAGFSLNISDENGWTALHHAIASKKASVVALFRDLWKKTDKKNFYTLLGTTPLHLSVMFDNSEITEFLLNNKFPILKDNDGLYPWHKIPAPNSVLHKLFLRYIENNAKTGFLIEKSGLFSQQQNNNCRYLRFDFGTLEHLKLDNNLNGILLIPPPNKNKHPDLEAVIKKNSAWIEELGLSDSQSIAIVKFPALVKCSLADVSVNVFQLMADFISENFISDDLLEKKWEKLGDVEHISKVLNVFMELYKNPELPTPEIAFPLYNNFIKAIHDISKRIKSHNEGMDLKYFYTHLESYFKSCIVIYSNRRNDGEYSENTFSFMRKLTLGLPPAIELCLIFNKINLTEDERNNPILKRLTEATLNAYATLNDIFSYNKEILKEKKPENIIEFKRQQYLKTMGESESALWKAFMHAIKHHNREMNDIFSLGEKLPQDSNIKKVYEILIKLLRDNAEWHIEQARLRYQLQNFVYREFNNLSEAQDFKFSEQSNDNQPGPISHMNVKSF